MRSPNYYRHRDYLRFKYGRPDMRRILIQSAIVFAVLWAGGIFSYPNDPTPVKHAALCHYSERNPYAGLSVNSTFPQVATVYVDDQSIGRVPVSSDVMRSAMAYERSRCRATA